MRKYSNLNEDGVLIYILIKRRGIRGGRACSMDARV
jgi:hypothetical protein